MEVSGGCVIRLGVLVLLEQQHVQTAAGSPGMLGTTVLLTVNISRRLSTRQGQQTAYGTASQMHLTELTVAAWIASTYSALYA